MPPRPLPAAGRSRPWSMPPADPAEGLASGVGTRTDLSRAAPRAAMRWRRGTAAAARREGPRAPPGHAVAAPWQPDAPAHRAIPRQPLNTLGGRSSLPPPTLAELCPAAPHGVGGGGRPGCEVGLVAARDAPVVARGSGSGEGEGGILSLHSIVPYVHRFDAKTRRSMKSCLFRKEKRQVPSSQQKSLQLLICQKASEFISFAYHTPKSLINIKASLSKRRIPSLSIVSTIELSNISLCIVWCVSA